MRVDIKSVAESPQMINESSFPVNDIYLTLANINLIFYQFQSESTMENKNKNLFIKAAW